MSPDQYQPGDLVVDDLFWSKVEKSDDCWLWTGTLNNAGYGQVFRRGLLAGRRAFLAHRYAYELLVGPVPEGLVLDHLCRTPACVNPAHLEPVTQAVNVRRGPRPKASRCPQDHEYTPDNTYVNPRGRPECRTCRKARR